MKSVGFQFLPTARVHVRRARFARIEEGDPQNRIHVAVVQMTAGHPESLRLLRDRGAYPGNGAPRDCTKENCNEDTGSLPDDSSWVGACHRRGIGPNVENVLHEQRRRFSRTARRQRGHGLVVASSVCTVEGGPLNGSVSTQNVVWEGDKGTSTVLSGDGVTRKPGTTAAFPLTGGTLTMVMKDGKPAGWTASGTAVTTIAVGEAASMNGKSFTWSGQATGPRTYVIESKLD